ncbi:bumetanide-sensitive sodium-(potassium)-chloride cotransporter-like [Leptidea sinapis]|uniref:bumetanide-sensitive sodium-(potassium)-chloride cotransporter-like n=1 Tax=Leptidea sinapis TaxID=189913 RepID=UPI00212AA145|nr:bumetanide-sensitive sodium-(potassium)-chloride cotransporter-like [Leptidea sinapis]
MENMIFLTMVTLNIPKDYKDNRNKDEVVNNSALPGSATIDHEDKEDDKLNKPTPELRTYNIKLGWIQGVLIPCLLNIWGVMLFLRIAWIVGQAGIGTTIAIIFLSGVVCVITALSLSAICTNGVLQGGGVYYIVSRSLGAELGASVGIIFAFANSVAASMNTIGFCESLNALLKSNGLKIIDNDVNDVRIVGAVALLVMCVICAIGMDWETKTQNILIIIIVVAIFNYIIGVFVGPLNDTAKAQGFVGISLENAKKNFGTDFRYDENQYHDFFSVFAMYFPAVTGVQAGANICGDLKDPATAIPKGTLLALGISMTSYLVMAVLCGMAALRDASGSAADLVTGNLHACKPNCPYGLHNDYAIMQLMSLSSVVIYAGCWAATLSTALTNLLSVPRLVQALGIDRIYPGLIFFSKPYGKHGEPYRGYVLTFIVSLLFLLIADLNAIAPLITNFYLASYALINFCTFHAAFVMAINWRPSFRYYNIWLSLLGFLMCAAIMIVISWITALTTIIIFVTLYLLVLYRKPEVNWGSSTEAQRYNETVSALVQMSHQTGNIKSYNPQLLVLAGRAYLRPALLDIAHLVTKNGSFMIVAEIIENSLSYSERLECLQRGEGWLQSRKHRGFFVVIDGFSFEDGLRAAIETAGLGRLSPNIVLIGYKNHWAKAPLNKLKEYVRMIQIAFEYQLAVTIFRVSDTSTRRNQLQVKESVTENTVELRIQSELRAIMNSDSDIETSSDEATDSPLTSPSHETPPDKEQSEQTKLSPKICEQKSGIFKPLEFFGENLDAWWLYDDGGLNVLLSYIIAIRGFRTKLPLRIFALSRASHGLDEAQTRMAEILQKFRIEYTSLMMIRGLNVPPREETQLFFSTLIQDLRTDSESDTLIQDSELISLNVKTQRYLRLRELLLEHSSTSSMIVVTLPMPRQFVSAAMYMAWLEILSRDLPPTLFVRGNDVSVISAS